MGHALAVRQDFTAAELRRLATRTKDVAQARRLLAIAAILDGAPRAEAARIGGMDRQPQTLRDWVIRFWRAGARVLRRSMRRLASVLTQANVRCSGALCGAVQPVGQAPAGGFDQAVRSGPSPREQRAEDEVTSDRAGSVTIDDECQSADRFQQELPCVLGR
jgi:hypothetical protein